MILSLVRVVFLQPLNKLYNLIEILYNSSIICQSVAQKATVVWQSLFCVQRDSRSKASQLLSYLQSSQPSARVFDICTFHPKPLPLKKEGLVVAIGNPACGRMHCKHQHFHFFVIQLGILNHLNILRKTNQKKRGCLRYSFATNRQNDKTTNRGSCVERSLSIDDSDLSLVPRSP